MHPVEILRKKRDGAALTRAEIEAFVHGATSGAWPNYQTAALLMAIVLRGMNAQETAQLTQAMIDSGERLDWSDLPGPKVDKHSSGGVGDNSSLIVTPLAAACGCIVPMMSGRGLAHTGGTLDKLEAIPGFRVDLPIEEIRRVLKRTGCAMVGQTRELAPADRALYELRDVTATVESIPLITASIMSKKLAEGVDALVLDVKCGHGAFMKTRDQARALATSLVGTGRDHDVRTEALITNMDAPLGIMVGNALEVREANDVLHGRGPADLELLAVTLTTRMLVLVGRASSTTEAEAAVRSALTSGRGLEIFRRMIAEQSGDSRIVDDPDLLPTAPQQTLVRAPRGGFVGDVHAEKVGVAAMLLGAGRERVGQAIDHAVGVRVLAKPGVEVSVGDALAEVHHRGSERLAEAVPLLQSAWRIDDAPPAPTPLILETVQ
jgi:pyrimidine-nucleoside phosphorylase